MKTEPMDTCDVCYDDVSNIKRCINNKCTFLVCAECKEKLRRRECPQCCIKYPEPIPVSPFMEDETNCLLNAMRYVYYTGTFVLCSKILGWSFQEVGLTCFNAPRTSLIGFGTHCAGGVSQICCGAIFISCCCIIKMSVHMERCPERNPCWPMCI